MVERNTIDWIALVLLLIGGLNWGLVGAAQFNLVGLIFGSIAWLLNLVYILVGLSAIYIAYKTFTE
tara:strand:- start:219 stop:416 length:198 start_codon:yes stop_codon:yes gene_type:complete